jgi:hypothetical protein
MSTQASIRQLEECPTCRGRGFIRVEMRELFIPITAGYPTAKLVLAFMLGFLMLSPALLGLYWENLLARW